jgi:AcrR family transcriptional regulator
MGTDPRIVRSRAAVIAAAQELLVGGGIESVNIEAVAARSGVAKTTIYRQWEDRNHLLLDVLGESAVDFVVQCTDDLRADLIDALTSLAYHLDDPKGSAMIPALIEAAERDESFRDVSRPFTEARRKPIIVRLRRAVRDGQLPKGTDVELICSALAGPLFYRRLLTRQPVNDAKAIRHGVDIVLTGVRGG